VPKIRVLVVDDAVIFRRLVADELARDPAFEVVDTAANGRIALAKMTHVNPDVVVLDVEMPEMDGLVTLKELRKIYPRLPVIMFSALTERGAKATLEALALGATDYFTKPSSSGLEASLEVIREQLIPQIKAICARNMRVGQPCIGPSAAAGVSPTVRMVPRTASADVRILAIGVSTGGPNALADIFQQLPADFPVPILIVQHMPPMFTRLLAERLTAASAIQVQEARSGADLEEGKAWIAPGDYHMTVARDGRRMRLLLNQDPPENSCRPSVDVLFRSVASAFGPNTLSVVLTGMGQDGLRGCERLREAGGQIVVQDEASSVVWGMPGCVARAGLADRVLPLSLIADEILRRVRQNQVTA
jgi:two-component system, chemotaxis family, protein-glutamate methylesterase/glutaminase